MTDMAPEQITVREYFTKMLGVDTYQRCREEGKDVASSIGIAAAELAFPCTITVVRKLREQNGKGVSTPEVVVAAVQDTLLNSCTILSTLSPDLIFPTMIIRAVTTPIIKTYLNDVQTKIE